jgi:hypothetical protein
MGIVQVLETKGLCTPLHYQTTAVEAPLWVSRRNIHWWKRRKGDKIVLCQTLTNYYAAVTPCPSDCFSYLVSSLGTVPSVCLGTIPDLRLVHPLALPNPRCL